MTAEEYVVEKLTKTEKELAELKAEYEDLTTKVKRLEDQFGFITEALNPRIKVYAMGSRSLECDDVADWVKDGGKKVDRMIEIFGLEANSNA
jgi:archaellum component FlaC